MNNALTSFYQHVVPAVVTGMVGAAMRSPIQDMRHWTERMWRTSSVHDALDTFSNEITTMPRRTLRQYTKQIIEHLPNIFVPCTADMIRETNSTFDHHTGTTVRDWIWMSLLQRALGAPVATPTVSYSSLEINPVENQLPLQWDYTLFTCVKRLNSVTSDNCIVSPGRPLYHLDPLFHQLMDQFNAQLPHTLRNLEQFVRDCRPVYGDVPDSIEAYRSYLDLDSYTPHLNG